MNLDCIQPAFILAQKEFPRNINYLIPIVCDYICMCFDKATTMHFSTDISKTEDTSHPKWFLLRNEILVRSSNYR